MPINRTSQSAALRLALLFAAIIVIQGIWSLKPGNVSPSSIDPDDAPEAQIYFTAGPNNETAGLFGYLTAVPTELAQGSDQ